MYRGQAMAQLRILKQQMSLGRLTIGSRTVNLGTAQRILDDGSVETVQVICTCKICFNLEECSVAFVGGTETTTTTTTTTTTGTPGSTTYTTTGTTSTSTTGTTFTHHVTLGEYHIVDQVDTINSYQLQTAADRTAYWYRWKAYVLSHPDVVYSGTVITADTPIPTEFTLDEHPFPWNTTGGDQGFGWGTSYTVAELLAMYADPTTYNTNALTDVNVYWHFSTATPITSLLPNNYRCNVEATAYFYPLISGGTFNPNLLWGDGTSFSPTGEIYSWVRRVLTLEYRLP
jgi:hypothetical protein